MTDLKKINTCGHLEKSQAFDKEHPSFVYRFNSGSFIHRRGHSECLDNAEAGFTLRELYLAMGFALSIDKQKAVNKSFSSYSLKQMCEVYIDDEESENEYIPNGAMIAAMIMAGFDLFYDGLGPNVFFNMKTKKVSRYKG